MKNSDDPAIPPPGVGIEVVAWLSPPRPPEPLPPLFTVLHVTPEPPPSGWRRLFQARPRPAAEAPVATPPPEETWGARPSWGSGAFTVRLGQQNPLFAQSLVVGTPEHPAAAVVRRSGIPATRLSAVEKDAWRERIFTHYGVLPQTYLFLCLFPHLPDVSRLRHHFDSANLEMTFEFPPDAPTPFPLIRLVVLQDLKTRALIRISLPLNPDSGEWVEKFG